MQFKPLLFKGQQYLEKEKKSLPFSLKQRKEDRQGVGKVKKTYLRTVINKMNLYYYVDTLK